MLGYAGYVNFGSIVFFGLGGYICVYLMGAPGWPLAAAALAAGVAVSLAGACSSASASCACAAPTSRSRPSASTRRCRPSSRISSRGAASSGLYLSTELFQPLGGPMQALWIVYFLLVAVMGLSLYLSYAIKTSKFGLGLLAIGQNEDAAAVLGVPTPLYKALAYSASAFLPAIAGGLYFFKSAFIQPTDAFDLTLLDRGDRDRHAGRAGHRSPARRSAPISTRSCAAGC